MIKLDPALRVNREFQSALVRMGFWVFGVVYVGSAGYTGYYQVDWAFFIPLFGAYFLLFSGMLVSVLIRPDWTARQYFGLVLDITAVSLAIYLTRDLSPFFLIYIWIFIYAGSRYGRGHLIFASILSLIAYNLVLFNLGGWRAYPFEATFFLLLLITLPMYQYSLLRKLQQARREAEVANKARGDFLAVMTHELRTPLTGVVGMTNLLQSTDLTEEQREYVDSIGSSAEVLRALIGDVLDLSKIDAKKLHLESEAFDLRASMQEVSSALESQALAKGLELILRVDRSAPYKLIGDPLRVRQILFNLLGNAIKFTEQGEVSLSASWRPPEDKMPSAHLLLEVQDTGIGIPEDKLGEIFEGFRQADESTTRQFGGTGLGTTIARDLTRLMGGRIGVESKVGQGSRFWVRLPLQQGPVPVDMAETTRQRFHGLRALVFERNAKSRELIVATLAEAGMECDSVLDIAHLGRMTGETQTIDLLILADSRDRQDFQALLDLFRRALGADIPCLLLTYGTRRVDKQKLTASCLSKPFLAEDLIRQVHRILGQKASQPADTGECMAPEKAAKETPFQGLRVLAAEDNAIAGKVIRTLLEKQGCDVTLVDDGEQALDRARADSFTMALVDVHMPKLDGIAFTRAYRSEERSGQRMPIIALTANAAEDVKTKCIEAGMDDFLGKPVSPQELCAMVERYAGKGEGASKPSDPG